MKEPWEFRLPDIGEGVTEGEIVAWHVKPGEQVTEDQPMVEIMTDKVTVTIGAPKTGTILELRGKVGEVVAVHAVLVVFQRAESVSPPIQSAAAAVGDLREELPGMRPLPPPPSPGPQACSGYLNPKPLATPAVRRVAREMQIDLKRVPPTGEQGRVTKQDLHQFALPTEPSPSRSLPPSAHEERVPLVGLRRRIALEMQRSKQTIPHATFVEECDVSALTDLRNRLQAPAQARGVTLSFLPFVLKALVRSLQKYPALNSTLDETTQEIVYRKRYNIGIATSTEAGLVVPVVRAPDRLSLSEIAYEIKRLSTEAKVGSLHLHDVSDSTFTVTSLGKQGGLFATPIIHFPEAAILGLHQIKRRPVVRGDEIVIGEVMLLSLSFDHRIVDGDVAAAFLYDLIDTLEHPERLLL